MNGQIKIGEDRMGKRELIRIETAQTPRTSKIVEMENYLTEV